MKKLIGALIVAVIISVGFNVYQAQVNASLTEDVDIAYRVADDMALEVDACRSAE